MRYFNKNNRDIDGIILLDKPLWISSNELLQKVKRLFHANKAGHTGALDPLATGMLPICFGEATKFSQYLLEADKYYRVVARLGERTDTSDSTGQMISVRPVLLNKTQLESALDRFRGEIWQLPSMFSAVKHHGRPLYKYARKGITVERKARLIRIHNLHLNRWSLTEIELEIHCSKGTYIRTIIDDLGEHLGCGAHITELRRLSVAHYPAERMITLATLQVIAANVSTSESLVQLDALLLPIDSAVSNMQTINLTSDIASRVRLGQKIAITAQMQAGLVRMTEGKIKRFFGVGKVTNHGWLAPCRLVSKPRS